MSVRALAKRVGISPSQVSAIELGKSQPSAATLYAMVTELDLSIDELIFGRSRRAAAQEAASNVSQSHSAASTTPAAGPILRVKDRAEIKLDTGVVWQRLTPEIEPGVELLHTVYDVGSSSGKDHAMARHSGHEWGVILCGSLEVQIGFDTYELGPGDSICFESMTPHLFRNVGDEPVRAVWLVLDPERGSVASERPSHQENEDQP